jgi:hypothetical protein
MIAAADEDAPHHWLRWSRRFRRAGRRILAGVRPAWRDASDDDVAAFLERWRTNRWLLLRSAYDGLHQLVLAAWYGNPRAWPAIGYPGPPAIDG